MKHRWILFPSIAASVGCAALIVASPAAAQTINACVNSRDGSVRISATCTNKETPLSWNAVGPKGDKGDQGFKGDPGLNGLDGVSGYEALEVILTIKPYVDGTPYQAEYVVPCPSGKKVLGGGVMEPGFLDPLLWQLLAARPAFNGDVYLVHVLNSTNQNQFVIVNVTCADV